VAELVIGLLGDVMLGRGVAEALRRVDPQDVWAPEVRELAAECTLVIANLECCVSERGWPTERIPGKPFFFRAPPSAVRSLHAIGVRAVGLANNHALDYESEALADTLTLLREAEVEVAGAGDLRTARSGVILELAGRRLGLLALGDHPEEFAASPDAPGIAYADLYGGLPSWVVDELGRLRGECDLVVAFPHWGPNMTSGPTRWQRRAADSLQDAGADLVAGHSAHTFHGVGWTDRGPLIYDLGDALDDYAVDSTLRNDLGVFAVWRPGGGERALELVGLRLDYCHTRLAEGADAEWIAERLAGACGKLGTTAERVAEQRFRILPP
jgi:poly-gamma-glutamate capsule biosynthesis protein CapA/YwtB (metallophosphatase superfamily)